MQAILSKGSRLKRVSAVALVTICVALACFALVACGSSKSETEKVDSSGFIGDWTVTSIVQDGKTTDTSSLSTFGESITFTFNDDGTLSYTLPEEDATSGTWAATSSTEGTVELDGETLDMALSGDQLTITDANGGKMNLSKGISDSTSSTGTTSTGTSGTSGSSSSTGTTTTTTTTTTTGGEQSVPMDYTVANDATVTIKVTAKTYDEYEGAGYQIEVTDNSDKDIYVTTTYDSSSVNGVMNDMYLFATVKAGKKGIEQAYFADPVSSIDGLKDVEATIEVRDASSYDTIATYDFKPAD